MIFTISLIIGLCVATLASARIRAAMFRVRSRVVGLIALFVAIALLATYLSGYFSVDKCIDNGGRWVHEQGVCEYDSASVN